MKPPDERKIQRVFAESNTLVVTPQKVIDFNDNSQEILVGVEHLVARQEYNQTRKRMLIGKQDGAKLGNWTNGKPPFPYVYDRNTKNIVVDESKRETYNLMKKWLLDDDMPCYRIAITLNKMGVPSPGGSTWNENSVYRVLTNEVHMGIIVYGKTSGSGHKNKITKPLRVNDKSDWFVNRDCKHQIIKTEAEHDQIMSKLARKRIQPKEPRKRSFYPLTGLLFCGKCKRSMQFMNKAGRRLMVKTCQTRDAFGNRCYNQASYVDVVYHELQQRLGEYEQQIRQQTPQQPQADTSTLEIARNNRRDEMQELNKALERNEDIFLRGKFDEARYERNREMYVRDLQRVLDELHEIDKSIEVLHTSRTDEERLAAIEAFKDAWDADDISPEDVNRLAKAVIDRIEYVRGGDNLKLDIKFL